MSSLPQRIGCTKATPLQGDHHDDLRRSTRASSATRFSSTWDQSPPCAGQYLRKGSQLYVEGGLRMRKWADKDGLEKHASDIQIEDLQMREGFRRHGRRRSRSTTRRARNRGRPMRASTQPATPYLSRARRCTAVVHRERSFPVRCTENSPVIHNLVHTRPSGAGVAFAMSCWTNRPAVIHAGVQKGKGR